ncbi:MAG: hypothetical protein ACI9HI_000872, partial [Salinirussus sp.]
MRRRLLDVTAYTTLDFVDARAVHPDWEETAGAVVNVDTPDSGTGRGRAGGGVGGGRRDDDEVVHLSVELDAADLGDLPRHVDRLDLSPADARTLGRAL